MAKSREKKRKQVLVVHSFGKEFEPIFALIAQACAKAKAQVLRIDSYSPQTVKNSAINPQSLILSSDLVIADISHQSPNVMYEIGMRQATNLPLLLVANSSLNIPFDLQTMRVLIYDINAPIEFVSRLTTVVYEAISAPSKFAQTQSDKANQGKSSVFISYSHLDSRFLKRLLVHLKPLEKEGRIDLWVDTRLRAGDRWKEQIESALQKANVAVLLVSADFLASDFITENELPPLLRNAENQGTRIIPLLLSPCRFTRDKSLKHFQAMNDPREPLASLGEVAQEAMYDALSEEIERSLAAT